LFLQLLQFSFWETEAPKFWELLKFNHLAFFENDVKISPSVLANLSWWSRFLPVWNGSLKIQSDSDHRCFAFTSDTSDTACGGVSMDQALVHMWSHPLAPGHEISPKNFLAAS
jgi:hypothetical protein